MLNLFNKALNVTAAALFGSAAAYACYSQANGMVGSLDDLTLAAGGFLIFTALVVLAWFVVDSNGRRAI